MALAIIGLGTAVPPDWYDQRDGLAMARRLCCETQEQTTWLPNMYGHTGIDKRHLCLGRGVVDDVMHGTRHSQSVFLPKLAAEDHGPTTRERMQTYAEQAPLFAQAASAQALHRARIAPEAITHLVTVSCTGFSAPGWDISLIERLGLSRHTQRTHVGFMGCHGMLNGLRVARAFVEANPASKVLVCATELCSIHYYYGWDPQKVIANAIFADGAAAAVCSAGNAPTNLWRLIASGSYLVPHSCKAMTWDIGDHGFTMTLTKKVPEIIARNLRDFVEPWLKDHGYSLAEIRSWAIHPGGPKILDAAGEALALPPAQLQAGRDIFAAYGNMSSPTMLFILDHLQRRGDKPPCVALGFGPGLTVEAALFD